MGNVVKLENEKQNKNKNQVEIQNVYEGFVFQFLRVFFFFHVCVAVVFLGFENVFTCLTIVIQSTLKYVSPSLSLCVLVFAIFVCSYSIQFKIDDN